MSKLSESLLELLSEHGMNQKSLAAQIGISESRITDYIRNEKLPTVENAIKLADYFHCSIDFLFGRKYEKDFKNVHVPEDFSKRIVYLKSLSNSKMMDKEIYEGAKITKSCYYDWLKGRRQPSLDNVIKLADFLGCSIDFVLGREI